MFSCLVFHFFWIFAFGSLIALWFLKPSPSVYFNTVNKVVDFESSSF